MRTAGRSQSALKTKSGISGKKWEKTLKEGDPHYNPNLSLRTCHYEINAGVPKWLICG